jgi:MoaA/NifB/PqqE/SkfB family radical SAM enzyme
MSAHALLCIDAPSAGELAGARRLCGWALASQRIEALEVEQRECTVARASYGGERADVAQVHQGYPNGARCGFDVELPEGVLGDDGRVQLALTVREGRGRRRYRFDLELGATGVRHIALWRRGPLGRYGADEAEELLLQSLDQRPGLVLRLDIVNKCNLRCVMCHYSDESIFRRPARKLAPEEFRALFEDIAPQVRQVVLSCADEPLVSNHFSDIVRYLATEHPHVDMELCTNAVLMNGRIRNLLVEAGVAHLMLSIDGVKKETFESIRVGAKFERVLGNILALRDLKRVVGARHPRFVLDFVMMNRNVHEAPAFVELASRLDASLIDFRHVVPGPHFDDPAELLVHHQAKYNYYRREILAASRRFGVDVALPPAYETSERYAATGAPGVDLTDFEAVVADRAEAEAPVPAPRLDGFRSRHRRGTVAERFAGTYCERPFSEVLITDQNVVRPCPWHRVPLGRLEDGQSLSEIFFGEGFRRVRRNMLRPEGDPGCHGCPVKAGYLMSETAQFTGEGAALSRLKQAVRRVRAALG